MVNDPLHPRAETDHDASVIADRLRAVDDELEALAATRAERLVARGPDAVGCCHDAAERYGDLLARREVLAAALRDRTPLP